MELKYSLDKNDYLLHQLYNASKNKKVQRQRIRTYIYIIITFLALGFLFFKENKALFKYFLVVSLLTVILYPFYQRYFYKKHYERHILDNYKNVFGKENLIKFTDSQIEMSDEDSSGNINYSVLEEINEIGTHYFLKMNTGVCLLIPKKAVHNIQEFKKTLSKLKQQYNLKENIELNWKWK